MKRVLLFSSVILIAALVITKCCKPCVQDGESFEMPYTDSQNISFQNDSLKIIKFLVNKEMNLPPEEYCGNVGSSSYDYCTGDASAIFSNTEDSLIHIKIYFNTDGGHDDVDLPVYKNVIVNGRNLVIFKDKAYTSTFGGVVKKLGPLNLNGILYNDLVEFSRSADSLKENECGYILYSKSKGLIKFSVKRSDVLERWKLVN